MTDAPDDAPRASTGRDIAVLSYVTLVALLGLVSTAWTIHAESIADRDLNLPAIALFSVLLFFGASKNAHWLRLGPGGEVTPGWAFAFALMLLGSTSSAIAAMALSMAYSDIRGRQAPRRILFNVAQTALSLALGGYVLHVFDANGAFAGASHLSFSAAMAILAAGVTVLVANAVLVCIVLSLHFGSNLWAMLREGLTLSLTADGALMVLAPIFVITVEYSLLLVPVLAVTSFLVGHSARQSLDRAHDANHDPLTKLYNRRAFAAKVDEMLDSSGGASGALLLIDLDGFKGINDRLGHQTGDALLIALAERMQAVLPEDAVPARLGGDEFSIFLPDAADEAQTEASIHRWRSALSEPVDVDGCPLAVGMSVGVAFAPTHGTLLTDLLHSADVAMYEAKQSRSGVQVSHAAEATADHARIGLLGDLAAAIDTDQLRVRFRPQRRLDTGSVDRIEAHLVWSHPVHGVLAASDFMGPAEHTELVGPLTAFVIEQATHALVALGRPDLGVAIDVPSRTLQDPSFPDRVRAILARVGLEPHRVEFQLAEDATSADQTRPTIDHLRDQGITFAVEILDSEHSSFATLRKAGSNRLKLSAEFVALVTIDPSVELIAGAVVQVAHGLGIEVVADGVDDARICAALDALDCDLALGELVAGEMSLRELDTWLSNARATAPHPLVVG